MRNYVYISEAKLDVYYGQATETTRGDGATTAKITLGVFSVEHKERKTPILEHHQKIKAIERYLEEKNLIGDEKSGKEWISGTAELKGITNGGATIFVGYFGDESRDIVALLASRRHIIGRDGSADLGSSLSYHEKQRPVGRLGIEYFESNSNTLGYAKLLRDAFDPERFSEKQDFSFDSKEALLAARNNVTQNDIEAFPELDAHYTAFLKVWQGEKGFQILDFSGFFDRIKEPKGNIVQWIINILRKPVFRLRLGSERFRKYLELTKKRWWYEHWLQHRLDSDEKSILSSVYSVATSTLTGRKNKINFVARVLLDGNRSSDNDPQIGERVMVLSPLWMAIR